MIEGFLMLLNALFIIAAIAVGIFVFLGPVIELLIGMFLPEEFWDDDDDSHA